MCGVCRSVHKYLSVVKTIQSMSYLVLRVRFWSSIKEKWNLNHTIVIALITSCSVINKHQCICLCCSQETNECDPNPCLNNGICVDGVQAYTCNCSSFTENNVLTYYTGRNCSTGEKEKVMHSLDIVA